ncbi:phage antirepressor [Paenibacillus sp. FSL R10-2791]|uniref:phage antirepressor n=1 Tax=Paenibacillus sp. FSL R10-2791 TaxID=2954695 RepID=UPI0030F99D97
MNQLQRFMYSNQEVRSTVIDGQPWFVAKDVCDVLEISNNRDALNRLDEDEKDVVSTDTLGGMQNVSVVNEPGLYSLILGSRKPEAKQFKRWITHEVIPSIRKTGGYMIPQTMPETLRLLAAEIEKNQAIEAKNKQLAIESAEKDQKLKEQATPVAIYNLAISAHNTMSMQEVAKSLGTGRTKLYQILREEDIIMKNSTLPYQRFIDAGYFKVTERPRASGDVIVNDPSTRVYAKGFDYIARLLKKRAERKSARLENGA